MHIRDLDLNLLRVFDAVYRQKSVSRAAEALALSQPAVSQALTRLRLLMKDALFIRVAGGVMPTPAADTLARSVQQALLLLEQGLNEAARFDPARDAAHLSHPHERHRRGRVPAGADAPRAPRRARRARSRPSSSTTRRSRTRSTAARSTSPSATCPASSGPSSSAFHERYVVLARADHPLLGARPSPASLARLDYIVVRHHTETARVLERMALSTGSGSASRTSW